jgi:outer membrane protein W
MRPQRIKGISLDTRRIAGLSRFFLIAIALTFSVSANAQSPITPAAPKPSSPSSDTAMIFQPSEPLVKSAQQIASEYPNTWGLGLLFSDYGYGGGFFLGHYFSQDVRLLLTIDVSTAEGSTELDLVEDNKINNIYVIPIMLTMEYRLFRDGLSDNLRPYISGGAGPVIAMTTPYSDGFFSQFGDATTKFVPGGFVGVGANFGSDPKNTFAASLRYFIIPYPGSIQSTSTISLTNLSGIYLSASYGFNF